MAMNVGKIMGTVILIVITLGTLVALYPIFAEYIDNVTGSGFGGSALLTLAKTFYWLLSAAAILLEMLVGFGLFELMKQMNRLK